METPLRVLEKKTVLNIFKLVMESWPKDVDTPPETEIIKKTAEVAGISMATVYDIIKGDKTKNQAFPPGQDQTESTVLKILQEEGQQNADVRQEQLRHQSLASLEEKPLETLKVEWPQPIKIEPFGTYDTNEILATQPATKRKMINIQKQSDVTSTQMESRSRASPEQFAALLEFMESHGDIMRLQQGIQGRIKADRLWQQLVQLLNSIGGGVKRPLDKWKKVWADWKTKTKKKALAIRHEASGTGGAPSSSQTLTASEERVLGIMGLTAVIGQAGIEERGFDLPPSEINSLSPPTREYTVATVHAVCPSQMSATDEIMLDYKHSDYIQVSKSTAPPSLPSPSGELPRHFPSSVPMPLATSLTPPAPGPPPLRWSTPSARRRGLLRARTRRTLTPVERATSEFVAVEHRRIQLDADRERNYHDREMERLRLESRRIEMEENQNLILSRLAGALDNLIEILPQLRPSLPSTDIIP